MRQLLHFPPGDLVSCENWSSLKDAVSTALMDRNNELAVSQEEREGGREGLGKALVAGAGWVLCVCVFVCVCCVCVCDM